MARLLMSPWLDREADDRDTWDGLRKRKMNNLSVRDGKTRVETNFKEGDIGVSLVADSLGAFRKSLNHHSLSPVFYTV